MTEANTRLSFSKLGNEFDQFQNLLSTRHSPEYTSQTILIIVFHEGNNPRAEMFPISDGGDPTHESW